MSRVSAGVTAIDRPGASGRRRSRPGGSPAEAGSRAPQVLLATGLAAVLVAGTWGLMAQRGDQHADHPHVGDVVAFEGGQMVVDAVRDVDLSAPISGPGMSMGPSSGVPDIPDGYRWVSVDLTVHAAADHSYSIDPDAFTVTGLKVGRAAPIASDDGGTLVPAGAEVTRAFSYQVPADTYQLELWSPGADDPVMLQLGDTPAPHGH